MVKGDKFDYMGDSGKTADDLRKEGYIVWTPPLTRYARAVVTVK